MGDRGNIKMVFENKSEIYFYTHWSGSELPFTLRDALKRGKDRWTDEPYLARIIFSEMIKGEILGVTGYGISPYLCDNEHDILSVDCSKQRVTIEHEEDNNIQDSYSFEEYIKLDLESIR
jgi:hypothetical protein